MLLPSDVARLVLGYLQEEGLSATSQAFVHESPNLKEYSDHTTGDGTIPACLFSIFGKGLTTILNEYVATKTKESHHEVPAVMTSLWKKLDFTLNQIKSLQNTPVISACQRTRSRIGVANMARQRVLTVASPSTIVCSSVSETSSIVSPTNTSQGFLSHSTPLSSAAPPMRMAITPAAHQQTQDVRLNVPIISGDCVAQMVISEQRLPSSPMSPGRRKWDTPRKRAAAAGVAGAANRCSTAISGSTADPQLEEVVDENFPQLVIQNARDKMLGDRSLQEKLAENINKILASDPVPQISKPSTTTLEADQSIDEILGLEGEIHMSDDAIHDILEQTESDPAFQALYELFDPNKTKFTDAEPGDGVSYCFVEECATPSAVVKPLQSNTNMNLEAVDTTLTMVKKKAGQDRKVRKTSTSLKKTILRPSGRSSRIENSSARLLVSQGEATVTNAAEKSSKSKHSPPTDSVFVAPMDTNEPLDMPPPPPDSTAVQKSVLKDSSSTSTAISPSTTPSSIIAAAFAVPEFPPLCNSDPTLENAQTQPFKGQSEPVTVTQSHGCTNVVPVTEELNSFPAAASNLPQTATSVKEGNTQPMLSCSSSPESASSLFTSSLFTAAPDSKTVSTSVGLITTNASSVLASSAPPTCSTAPTCSKASRAAHDLPPNQLGTSKPGDDASVVSLKIIISDDKDEESSSDPALSQAVSSISGEKIPTIYLSSPDKSPGVPGTPRIFSDEVAQAVSGLQTSEGQVNPLGSMSGTLVASPLTGAQQVQQNYIIQLPLDTTVPAVQGAPASYILVTETPNTNAATRQVLLSAGVSKGPSPFSQYGVPAQASSPSCTAGSTFILPSPAKPVMLPVSVMGQNAMGPVQMVHSQFVTIQNAVPVQPPVSVSSNSPTVSVPFSTTGTEQVDTSAKPLAAENKGQQKVPAGTKHKRILCFESSGEDRPQKNTISTLPPSSNTPISQSSLQPKKDIVHVTRTRPNILGGNRPKRRLQPVRCLKEPQTEEKNMKELDKTKDPFENHIQKLEHNIRTEEMDSSQQKNGKRSDSEGRSKSVVRKHNEEDADGAKEDQSSRPVSSDSERNGEKEESSQKEPPGKVLAKPREGCVEKKAPLQEVHNVTANKENEVKDTVEEQQAPSSSSAKSFSPQAAAQNIPDTQPKTPKAPSKTSSLAKQAAEMLHDIQGHHSPSEHPSHNQEESTNVPRTPGRQKKGKDGEGTPKHLLPPNTPEVPSSSPVSEAGSENSINMAAHTLMILSRATIARTGTPLKDSLRQDGVGDKIPSSSKNSKKRKLTSPTDTPPAKKDRERKKLMDCFPDDLDVEKFLSSLHYDE
ncbi:protein NPAT isoform X2 [Takifugu flavidus]|uniref:protein NPAT isoform X2 n=1 Tax=Takifugu flavidus TaxID=433684 RepID=UPI00254493AF|nr:protein NPAT isoform X2 [Takifugu flavidus]